jgi:SOS-response transcriptional repressor LexA
MLNMEYSDDRLAAFNRLCDVLREKGIYTPDFYNSMGLDYPTQTWNNWKNRGLPRDKYQLICKLIPGLNYEYLATGKGEKYKTSVGFRRASDEKKIKIPAVKWSEFCINPGSITKNEHEIMIIPNNVTVSAEAYIIEIDNNSFNRFAIGTRILIDPKIEPKKNDIVLMSICDGIPSLVRWNPGLGRLRVAPLENGFPESVSISGKKYSVLGVAVLAKTTEILR